MRHIYPDWIDLDRMPLEGLYCGLCGNAQRYESFHRSIPDKESDRHRGNPNIGLRMGLRQSHKSQCPLFSQNDEIRALPTHPMSPVGKYE